MKQVEGVSDYVSVGDLVEYRSPGSPVAERGFVTSRNDRFVFVRFGLDLHAKACAPQDLRASSDERP